MQQRVWGTIYPIMSEFRQTLGCIVPKWFCGPGQHFGSPQHPPVATLRTRIIPCGAKSPPGCWALICFLIWGIASSTFCVGSHTWIGSHWGGRLYLQHSSLPHLQWGWMGIVSMTRCLPSSLLQYPLRVAYHHYHPCCLENSLPSCWNKYCQLILFRTASVFTAV